MRIQIEKSLRPTLTLALIIFTVFLCSGVIYDFWGYPDSAVRVYRMNERLGYWMNSLSRIEGIMLRAGLSTVAASLMLFFFRHCPRARLLATLSFLAPGFFLYNSTISEELLFVLASLIIAIDRSINRNLVFALVCLYAMPPEGLWLCAFVIGKQFFLKIKPQVGLVVLAVFYFLVLYCALFQIQISDIVDFLGYDGSNLPGEMKGQIRNNLSELSSVQRLASHYMNPLFSLSAPIPFDAKGNGFFILPIFIFGFILINTKHTFITIKRLRTNRDTLIGLWAIGLTTITSLIFPLHADPKHYVIVIPFIMSFLFKFVRHSGYKARTMVFVIWPAIMVLDAVLLLVF